MRHTIKSGIKRSITAGINIVGSTSIGRYLYARIVDDLRQRMQLVEHNGAQLWLCTPNALSRYRADTFSTKEPETLEWIDGMPMGAVVWDVGANVGLYSCYAAKRRGCRVFAFEPSVFNLELLARNIFVNGLTEQITIVPLPLSETLGVNTLNMSSIEWGGALSTFGQDYGHDGRAMRKIFEFRTTGLSMVDAVRLLNIPQPEYVKMDVDGIEHLILKGGMPTLAGVESILIEINDEFATQANDASVWLRDAGFLLKEKRHAEIAATGAAQHTFNQIWARS